MSKTDEIVQQAAKRLLASIRILGAKGSVEVKRRGDNYCFEITVSIGARTINFYDLVGVQDVQEDPGFLDLFCCRIIASLGNRIGRCIQLEFSNA